MTEETVKQMTWHKKGVRCNPKKMVHPSNGKSLTHFDGIHREKAEEACNVGVVLGMVATLYSGWNVFVIPLNPPPGAPISTIEHIHVIDYYRALGE